MNLEKFTIIIPTYNRSMLLKKAVISALRQTWNNLSILVLDNASTDQTQATVHDLQEKDPRIQYIRHHQNIGMLAQYQYGLDQVQSEFFSFLSDDDLLLPTFCETVMQGFQLHPDCSFYAGSSIIYSPEKGILRIPLDLWPYEGRYTPDIGLYEMVGKYPVPNTVAFRKSFLSKIAIDTENQAGWDCDFLLQLAARYPFFISKKITGIFFSHPTSFTSSMSYETSRKSIVRLIERASIIDPNNPSRLTSLLEKDLMMMLASVRKFSKSYDVAKILIKKSPRSIKLWLLVISLYIFKTFPLFSSLLKIVRWLRTSKKKQTFSKYEEYICDLP